MAKYKAKKRFNLTHPLFLGFFLLFVTANIFLAGYLNSQKLDIKDSQAYLLPPPGPVPSAADAQLLIKCNNTIYSRYNVSASGFISHNSVGGAGDCSEQSNAMRVSTENVTISNIQYFGRCCLRTSGYNEAVSNNCGSGTVSATFVNRGNVTQQSNYSTSVRYTCQVPGNINCVENYGWDAMIENYRTNSNLSSYDLVVKSTPNQGAGVQNARGCEQITGKNIFGWIYSNGFCCP